MRYARNFEGVKVSNTSLKDISTFCLNFERSILHAVFLEWEMPWFRNLDLIPTILTRLSLERQENWSQSTTEGFFRWEIKKWRMHCFSSRLDGRRCFSRRRLLIQTILFSGVRDCRKWAAMKLLWSQVGPRLMVRGKGKENIIPRNGGNVFLPAGCGASRQVK